MRVNGGLLKTSFHHATVLPIGVEAGCDIPVHVRLQTPTSRELHLLLLALPLYTMLRCAQEPVSVCACESDENRQLKCGLENEGTCSFGHLTPVCEEEGLNFQWIHPGLNTRPVIIFFGWLSKCNINVTPRSRECKRHTSVPGV